MNCCLDNKTQNKERHVCAFTLDDFCCIVPASALFLMTLCFGGHVELVLQRFIGFTLWSTLLLCTLAWVSPSCHPAPLGHCSTIVERRQLTDKWAGFGTRKKNKHRSAFPTFPIRILLATKENQRMTCHRCFQDFGNSECKNVGLEEFSVTMLNRKSSPEGC